MSENSPKLNNFPFYWHYKKGQIKICNLVEVECVTHDSFVIKNNKCPVFLKIDTECNES